MSFHDNLPFQQLIAAEQRAVTRRICVKQLDVLLRNRFAVLILAQVVFLHTMRNEHFGISLVEAMAAGAAFALRALPHVTQVHKQFRF